ncbi:alpha/beta hydrolase [Flavicella sediminum]|uniref:alpha/beta hydrolase n=1 Tax=Flavicella sediminum TaxID=2585141 RepID=UPI00111D5568|nr:alpha/beta hydrolase family protein [Flavicella sediminum]
MKQFLLFLLLLLFSFTSKAAKTDSLLVHSKVMTKEIPNIIITPDSYKNSTADYPVLYLLHGAFGNHKDWSQKTSNVQRLADQYHIIVVCPNGGFNSWYFDSPIDPKMQYETYISKELVQAVDAKYRTIKNKSGRAIAGLSMGGHGAFYLAFKHQDIWGAAGSMSGGVDIRPFPNNWDIAKRLGSYAENKDNWENNTVINLAYLLNPKSLKLIFECGTGDFFYEANARLHKKLLERNIPHDYTERPGKHDWKYWNNAIKYQFVFFNDFFKEKK